MKRPGDEKNYLHWFLLITGWLMTAYLFVSQVLPAADYQVGVAMETQDSTEVVGETGVAFFKGFAEADAFIYVPLLVMGLIGHAFSCRWYPAILGAALGISAYWPVVCWRTMEYAILLSPNLHDDKEESGKLGPVWKYSPETIAEYRTVLPLLSAWALFCLCLLVCLPSSNNGARKTKNRHAGIVKLLAGGGILAPFLYLVNDMMQCALLRTNDSNHELSCLDMTVSDLASAAESHWLTPILLVSSAISSGLFGVSWMLSSRVVVGTLQIIIGFCNTLTATKYSLASPITRTDKYHSIANLPYQSQVHIFLVFLCLITTIVMLVSDAAVTGAKRTKILGFATFGFSALVVSNLIPSQYLGLLERASVYTIQLWYVISAWSIMMGEHERVSFGLLPKLKEV